MKSTDIAERLAAWFEAEPPVARPWLGASTRWQVVAGEILLHRAPAREIAWLWPILASMTDPSETVSRSGDLFEMAAWIDRSKRAAQIFETASWLVEHLGALEDSTALRRAPHVTQAIADLAVLVVEGSTEATAEEPVLAGQGSLRVAAKYFGLPVHQRNRLTDGRLKIARMIGGSSNSRAAQLAMIELAGRYCLPARPQCERCPLAESCVSAEAPALALALGMDPGSARRAPAPAR